MVDSQHDSVLDRLVSNAARHDAIGVLYALTAEEIDRLVNHPDPAAYVTQILDREFALSYRSFVGALGEAWHRLHRFLSNRVFSDTGRAELLAGAVIGGDRLVASKMLIVVKQPQNVAEVAEALASFHRDDIRAALASDHDNSEYDVEYTLGYFERLASLYRRAAGEGRHVIFTVIA